MSKAGVKLSESSQCRPLWIMSSINSEFGGKATAAEISADCTAV